MKKTYNVKSAVYDDDNNIASYETIVVKASNETEAHAIMDEFMMEWHQQEAYAIDTTIEEVK